MKTRSPRDPRLLCVEPEPAARAALASALLAEGYRVDTAASGDAGLELLRKSTYDLVIASARPGAPDRAWLARAAQAGILGRSLSLLVSAERASRRDFDLPLLMAQVHTLLAASGAAQEPSSAFGGGSSGPRGPELGNDAPVRLTLYVSTQSPSSMRAHRRLTDLIARFPRGHVELTVRDLALDPRAAQDEDRVVFTPTLVRKLPLPKVWVIGDLDDAQLILDLLTTAGVEPSP